MTISAKLAHKINSEYGAGSGTELIGILNAADADNTEWTGTSVTASSFILAPEIATGTARPYSKLTEDATDASFLIDIAAGTAWEMLGSTGGSGTLIETVTCATGKYDTSLTANLADAWSITDGTAELLVFVTTTSALAVKVSAALVSTPPANQTLTNSATITLPVGINKVVDNGGAVTGIIMTAGIADGQIVNIINAAAASVTFAVAGTSNVADGTSAVIAANRAVQLIYDSGTSLWYRTG